MNTNYVDETFLFKIFMENTLKSNAINFGLYLGLGLSLLTVVGYAVNIAILVNFWLMILILPLAIIALGIISTAKGKSINGGYLSFKEAFSSYFITVAIGIMISTVVSLILFNFIDPDAAIEMKNIMVSQTETFLSNSGAPPEKIAENIEKIESQDTFGIGTQLKSLAQSLIFFAIVGLIVAAAMKKSRPDTK